MLNRVLTAFRRRFTAAPKWRHDVAPDPVVPPQVLTLGGQSVEVVISRAALVEILPAIWRIETGLRNKVDNEQIVEDMIKTVVAATGRLQSEVEQWPVSESEMVALTSLIETATRVAVGDAGPPIECQASPASAKRGA